MKEYVDQFGELNIDAKVSLYDTGHSIRFTNGTYTDSLLGRRTVLQAGPYRNSSTKPIRITEAVATLMAEVIAKPTLASFDLYYLHSIDEAAKPILEKAIMDNNTCTEFKVGRKQEAGSHAADEAISWLQSVLVKAKNPNLREVEPATPALSRQIAKNKEVTAQLLLKMFNDKDNLTAKDCENINERMPSIAYELNALRHNHGNPGLPWQLGLSHGSEKMLALVKKMAKDKYGIVIELPNAMSAQIQEQAQLDEIAAVGQRHYRPLVMGVEDDLDGDGVSPMAERAQMRLHLQEHGTRSFVSRYGQDEVDGWERG